MFKTGLVGVSAGPDFPPLVVSALARNILTAEGEFVDLEEAERQIRKVPIVRQVFLYTGDFLVCHFIGVNASSEITLPVMLVLVNNDSSKFFDQDKIFCRFTFLTSSLLHFCLSRL